MLELSKEDESKLWDFVHKGKDDSRGSNYPGMTYEDGIELVLHIMNGDTLIDEELQ